jgi:hypothetical protein
VSPAVAVVSLLAFAAAATAVWFLAVELFVRTKG